LHDEKVLVWSGMSEKIIYRPYYFETSVNRHNYLSKLKLFYDKHRKAKEYKNYYFQQDGLTPHTANAVQTWLTGKFGDKFLPNHKWHKWLLKERVYSPLPKTLYDLKTNIEREIKNINKKTLKTVFENFQKRCNLVLSAEGGHIKEK